MRLINSTLFIETNIRAVFIHHFFEDRDDIGDTELLPYIERALVKIKNQKSNPYIYEPGSFREWYWALMDYGTHLKNVNFNEAGRRSKHHVRQSAYHGSRRQLRANVLKALITQERSLTELIEIVDDERLGSVLTDLINEELIIIENNRYRLV